MWNSLNLQEILEKEIEKTASVLTILDHYLSNMITYATENTKDSNHHC